MIEIAKQNNKKVKFYHTDINCSKEKFDLISLFGVLSFLTLMMEKK